MPPNMALQVKEATYDEEPPSNGGRDDRDK
jgi:hypothetical protein